MDILSPSLMCCDWLHLQDELTTLENAGVDRLHYDLMDMSMTTCTMLMPTLLPQIKKSTKLAIDVHVMSMEPERYLPLLLPCCEGMYVSLHAEAGRGLYYTLDQLQKAGAKVSLALNKGTPACMLEDYYPMLDMVLVINGVAGITGPRIDPDEALLHKIAVVREGLNAAGRKDAEVEVDGNVSFTNACRMKRYGANAYVLGTASIFHQPDTVAVCCQNLRRELSLVEERKVNP